MKSKTIKVVPYDPNWPYMFEQEAAPILQALSDNCIAIHHVGSTSVAGLAAKPIIDMIVVVKNPILAKTTLESIGIRYKGEYNIPLHYGFDKKYGDKDFHIHVYEDGHPEIMLNLTFRDYLRKNQEAKNQYANLKYKLLEDPSTHECNDNAFTRSNYTLRKGDFIREILRQTGFNKIRMLKCNDSAEWAAVKYFRRHYFFSPQAIDDPYTLTFNHENHSHLVLYQGAEIVAYTHIQFWPGQRAAIRIIATDENKRNQSFGSRFLKLIEKWLKNLGVKSIHAESRQSSLQFYLKNGYSSIPFDDPENHESDPNDVPVGKVL